MCVWTTYLLKNPPINFVFDIFLVFSRPGKGGVLKVEFPSKMKTLRDLANSLDYSESILLLL